ncbi:MAG: hypothetical protein M3R24_17095 [Chloroflexota bacterium]|nr:hypothetical protein [Chloroflexota bacterium]
MEELVPQKDFFEEGLTPEQLIGMYQAADPRIDHTLLKGLETVDWSRLGHAHGKATDVPALLRATLSGNPHHRDFAFQLLHETIWHQGTVYQATQYVVPFLIGLLTHSETPDKAAILRLLQCLSTGYPSVSEHDSWQREWFAKQDRDFQAAVAQAADEVQQAHDAVRRGLYQYFALLHDQHTRVRRDVIPLLCTFPEAADRVLPVLQQHLNVETDHAVKAEVIEQVTAYLSSLSTLAIDTKVDFVRLFQAVVDSNQEPLIVRFAAAVALADLIPRHLPDRVIAILLDAIAAPAGVSPRYFDDPRPLNQEVCEDIVVDRATEALSFLDGPRSLPYLMQALSLAITAEHAHTIAIMLLSVAIVTERYKVSYRGVPAFEHDTVYYACVYPRAPDGVEERIYPVIVSNLVIEELTDIQRQAIKAVVGCKRVWDIRSNLLEVYGLPRSPVEVEQMLA